MKRIILTLILILSAIFGIFGQNNAPIDLVLLLNTSSGMSSSYENVSDYITGRFLSDFLALGDTFHLIPFSDSPRLDIARRIISSGDIETIAGRMLLQYPIESGSNASAALTFAEQYITSLPARPKKIVLVSTGGSDINNLINASRDRLRSGNTTLDFVQVNPGQPLTNLPVSGRSTTRVSQTAPGSIAQSAAPATAPASASAASPAPVTSAQTVAPTTAPVSTTAASAAPTASAQLATPAASPASADAVSPAPTASTQTASPSSTASASTDTASSAPAASTQTASPAAAPVSSQETSSVTESTGNRQSTETNQARSNERPKTGSRSIDPSVPLIAGLIILLLLILGLIIFFASRKLGSSPNRVISGAAASKPFNKEDTPFVDHSKELANYAAANRHRTTPYSDRSNDKPVVINPTGPLLLNLFVEDQNTAIGKRNIHSLKSGYSLSVGGGKSDFLIFLVSIPSNIGELRRNGGQLTFIPKKPKYFPDLGSSELRDCLNKTIRIISDRNYEIRFRFEMYEDPLIALNRMLMKINVPG